MIELVAVKNWIKTLNAKADNYYIGKLDAKKDKSIGVYNRSSSATARVCVGGMKNTCYEVKHISLLIHWTSSFIETERFAFLLQEELLKTDKLELSGHKTDYLHVIYPEPIDVDTDGKIYERVIEFDLYYKKQEVKT